jgi:hypothetical protein
MSCFPKIAHSIPEMRHPYQIKNLRFYQEHDCHGYAHFQHKRVISTISIMCLFHFFFHFKIVVNLPYGVPLIGNTIICLFLFLLVLGGHLLLCW